MAENEIAGFNLFRRNRLPEKGIRKAVVGNQLPVIEGRQDAVELRLGVAIPLPVGIWRSLTAGAAVYYREIADHLTVNYKRSGFRTNRCKAVEPRQQPGQQSNGYDGEKDLKKTGHIVFRVRRCTTTGSQSWRPSLKRFTDTNGKPAVESDKRNNGTATPL